MVPPEHDGHRAFAEGAVDLVALLLAGVADLLEVLHARIAGIVRLLDENVDVPVIGDLVAERAHARMDLRDAERGRPHVDAAPSGSEVQGHADEPDLLRGHDPATLARPREGGQRTRPDADFG